MSNIQQWEYHRTISELKRKEPEIKPKGFWKNLAHTISPEYEWIIYYGAEYWPLSEGLNKYGAEGWELVGIAPLELGGKLSGGWAPKPEELVPDKDISLNSSKFMCIFKRPAN